MLQGFQHARLRDLAERQYSRQITLHPERGRNLDRHGRVLATSVPVPSVYVIPQDIDDSDAVASKLAEVLGQPLATVQDQLSAVSTFVWLARQLPPEVGERVQKLNMRGVQVLRETRRFYSKRHLAGQVLGFVGVDGAGLGGLEHLYNRELTGTPRQVTLRVMNRPTLQVMAGDPRVQPRGADLYLTLDERLEYIAEEGNRRPRAGNAGQEWPGGHHAPADWGYFSVGELSVFNPNDFQYLKQRVCRGTGL